jgi:hypothetical protein
MANDIRIITPGLRYGSRSGRIEPKRGVLGRKIGSSPPGIQNAVRVRGRRG